MSQESPDTHAVKEIMTDETEVTRAAITLLRRLRAVRQFQPEPVPESVLDDVLEVARWTGSARNVQPWEFIVVRDRAMLQALADTESTAKHLAGAPLAIALVMAGDPQRLIHETFDEGRLSERIQLAAAAHGVGSCIGWFHGSGLAEAKALLGVPSDRSVRTAISLGYPDTTAIQRPARAHPGRKPATELVHYERYGQRTP
jgi:nitroreductase